MIDPYSRKVEFENQIKELREVIADIKDVDIKEAGVEVIKLLELANEKALELMDPLIKEEESERIEKQISGCLEIVEQFRVSIIDYLKE